MFNPFCLTGKHILVTGASSGIGRSVSEFCARMGASLTVSGRHRERLEQTLASLDRREEIHEAVAADLLVPGDLDHLVDRVAPFDGVVLSSGIMKSVPFKSVNEQTLDDLMGVNFRAPILLLNRLLKGKKIKAGASIVFISSIAGAGTGSEGNSVYAASKGAIIALQRSLALELSGRKIRVNSLAPGMVKTEMWQDAAFSTEQLERDEKNYPLGYGEPADVANAAVYLLSDASKWVTGTTIILDGGFSIR